MNSYKSYGISEGGQVGSLGGVQGFRRGLVFRGLEGVRGSGGLGGGLGSGRVGGLVG